MAAQEEARAGGEDGEGQEPRVSSGELTSEEKDTEQRGASAATREGIEALRSDT